MARAPITLCLLLLLATTPRTHAALTMNDLLDPKNFDEKGKLKITMGSIEFHKIDEAELIRFQKPTQNACGNGRPIRFETKQGETVFWGLASRVNTGLTYTPPGGITTEHKNHYYYEACSMADKLLENIVLLACDPRVNATTVIINSAFRDPIMNVLDGGTSRSPHLRCFAIDFAMIASTGGQRDQRYYRRVSPKIVQAAILARFPGITGLGKGNTFTHADVRPPQETKNGRAQWTYSAEVEQKSNDIRIHVGEKPLKKIPDKDIATYFAADPLPE